MNPVSEDSSDAPAARARLRGKRAALGVVIVISVAFIVASTSQIIPAVFGAAITPLAAGSPGSPERVCAVGVKELQLALDRAGGRSLAGTAPDPGRAMAAFRQGLSPEWDGAETVERACAETRNGLDTWAALQRLRFGEEQLLRSGGAALSPLRSDVAAHLPADLR
jgi:hypothetical protein